MILIDFSQQIHASAHSHFSVTKETISKDLLRHVILNNLFSLKRKLKDKSEILLCVDGRNYWRKQEFPFYKANRKLKPKDPDGINWNELYGYINELKEEWKEELPFKMLEVNECEADDIIAFISLFIREPIIIVSSDKDFLQLQEYRNNIKQYSHITNKWLEKKDYGSLFEKVLRGDAGDGVPSYLSDSDVFLVEEKRQRPLTKKKVDVIISNIDNFYHPENFCESIEQIENFNRNKRLIDLRETPTIYQERIRDSYLELDVKKRTWFDYCVKYKLMNFLENQSWR